MHEVVGHDPAESLVAFATREKATQLVLGATRRSRWHELIHGSFVARVTRLAGEIDVHVIAHSAGVGSSEASLRRDPPTIDRRRLIAAWLLTAVGLPLLMLATVPLRDHLSLSTELLLALSLVLALAAIGGKVVAVVAAVAASLLVNWYYVPPYGTLTIAEGENITALIIFVAVAVGVGSLVDIASRRSLEARRARLEAEALARSATSLAADPEPLPQLVDQLRQTFDLTGVRIAGTDPNGAVTIAEAGEVDGVAVASIEPVVVTAWQPGFAGDTPGVRTRPVERRPPAAARVRRPTRRGHRQPATRGGSSGGRSAGRCRRPSHRAAALGLARPAHTTCLDQGNDLGSTRSGGALDRGSARRGLGDRRRGRPIGSTGSSATCSTPAGCRSVPLAIETQPTVVIDTVEAALQALHVPPDDVQVDIPSTVPSCDERPGPARTQPGQRDRQRAAPQPARTTRSDRGQPHRRLGARAHRRPRARECSLSIEPV